MYPSPVSHAVLSHLQPQLALDLLILHVRPQGEPTLHALMVSLYQIPSQADLTDKVITTEEIKRNDRNTYCYSFALTRVIGLIEREIKFE